MDEKGDRAVRLVTLAVIAGIAAGVAASLTMTTSPYAFRAALTAFRSKRKKKELEHRQNANASAKPDSGKCTVSNSKGEEAYKQAIRRGLISWRNIDVTFENFPYFLHENTKSVLVDSTYVYLKRPEFSKYITRLGSISPRILLTGPPGSEICQENLVRGLAHHLQVNLLVFDSTRIYLEVSESASRKLRGVVEESSGTTDESTSAVVTTPNCTREMSSAGNQTSTSDVKRESIKASGSILVSRRLKDANAISDAAGLGSLLQMHKGKGKANLDTECLVTTAADSTATASTTTTASITATAASSPPPSPPLPPPEARPILKKGDRVIFVGSTLPGDSGSVAVLNHGGPPNNNRGHGPPVGARGRVLTILEENPKRVGVRFDKPVCGGTNLVDLCEDGHGYFCNVTDLRLEQLPGTDTDKLVMESLLEVLQVEASKEPLILFIRNVEKSIVGSSECYLKLERMENTDAKLVVIASHISDQSKEKKPGPYVQGNSGLLTSQKLGNSSAAMRILDLSTSFLDYLSPRTEDSKGEGLKASRLLQKVLPARVQVQQPQEEGQLSEWNRQLEVDTEQLQAEANRQQLRMVMASLSVECHDLTNIGVCTHVLTRDMAEKVVFRGVSRHLQANPEPVLHNGKLLIAAESLQHSLQELQSLQLGSAVRDRKKTLKDVVCDNEFEKTLLREVVPPHEVGVTFDHIGALDNVKETLRELVMLPLQRPELFLKGQLTKPCRGLLLFGPPGTGKTMLAKAVATEAGANFINISMSTIASKWLGEGEKSVKALFTLASKISPSVIFIDEVDSMLGQRGKETEHSAMRKLKNEFMASWDGLRTREKERVLVMAATNRPFDLDDAVIRRFPRRLMIDLPDASNRSKILRVILAEEDLSSDLSVDELANVTDGYSGSDLKSLCTTAAYRRIQELLDKEKEEAQKAKMEGVELRPSTSEPGVTPFIRPLSMADMQEAMKKVRSSVATYAENMVELQQWNEQYGEGGTSSKKRSSGTLTYFM